MEAHVLGSSINAGWEDSNPRVSTLGVGKLAMMGNYADIKSNLKHASSLSGDPF